MESCGKLIISSVMVYQNCKNIFFCSIRLLPHHQDTGAFFVALFQKHDKTIDSSSSTEEEGSQKRPFEEPVFNEEG